MQKTSILNRFLVPLILALVFMAASRIVFVNSIRITNPALYHSVALISGTIQFASIVLVAFVLYPITYFRGASATERVIACSTNLAVWIGIDAYHVSQAFPLRESLYYGIGIGLVLFSWNFFLMSILEFSCRLVVKKRGEQVRVVTPLPVVPILLFLSVIYLLSRERGAYYFNLLLDGYLRLFRT